MPRDAHYPHAMRDRDGVAARLARLTAREYQRSGPSARWRRLVEAQATLIGAGERRTPPAVRRRRYRQSLETMGYSRHQAAAAAAGHRIDWGRPAGGAAACRHDARPRPAAGRRPTGRRRHVRAAARAPAGAPSPSPSPAADVAVLRAALAVLDRAYPGVRP